LGLFWFAAALLGAALIFAGCETEADTETKYVSGEMIHLDTVVSTLADLETALADDKPLAIGLNGVANLTDDLDILDGKLVYILNGGSLATSGKDLKVGGIVYVGINGTLDVSTGKVIVKEGGYVSVLSEKTVTGISVSPGTLKVATADSVNDGEASAKTVLGTDKVRILGTLAIGGTFTDVAALSAPFGYVGNGGTLDISAVTVTGSKPSTLVAAIPQGKNLKATAAGPETATTLVIPKGSDITALATDTLAAVTTLTVNGTFTTAAGTLAAVTALTVNGTLTASAAGTFAGLTTLTVDGTLTAGASGAFAALTTLTVNGTLSASAFTGATAGVALTVGTGGKATLGGTVKLNDSTVAADGVLTTSGTVTFNTTPAAATLGAAAGSTVNGFLFPADATITALAANAVTIDDLTIPATTTLTVAAGKTLTVDGTLDLAGTLALANTGKVVILATRALAATSSGKLLSGTELDDVTKVKLTVAATAAGAATKATVDSTTTSGVYLVASTTSTGSGAITAVGNAAWTFTDAAVDGAVATLASPLAAGTLKAATGTALTLTGST
jgi:hypothetical protein